MLLNEKATTKGILKGLDWLVKDAQAGDVLVFYDSSHGTQKIDLSDDEKDHLDEALVPVDYSFEDERLITDDQLFEAFTKKCPPGVRCDVLLDCCFSGSATRSLSKTVGEYQPTEAAKYRKQRYLPPPVDQQFRINSTVPIFTEKTGLRHSIISGDTKEIQQVTQNNCLWSGCAEYQVSYETVQGSDVRGVFTYYLCKILRASNGNITRGQAYSILRSTVANEGFEQTPWLEVPNYDALDMFPFRRERDVDKESEIIKKK